MLNHCSVWLVQLGSPALEPAPEHAERTLASGTAKGGRHQTIDTWWEALGPQSRAVGVGQESQDGATKIRHGPGARGRKGESRSRQLGMSRIITGEKLGRSLARSTSV